MPYKECLTRNGLQGMAYKECLWQVSFNECLNEDNNTKIVLSGMPGNSPTALCGMTYEESLEEWQDDEVNTPNNTWLLF